mgnify:CR=1 FL=1
MYYNGLGEIRKLSNSEKIFRAKQRFLNRGKKCILCGKGFELNQWVYTKYNKHVQTYHAKCAQSVNII